MMRILAVGQCAIEVDGKRLSSESEVVFGLALHLAARAGDVVPRDELQALLWPELSHTRGRHCLRQAAYRVRQLGVPLRSDNESLSIALGDVGSDYAALVADDAPAARFGNGAIREIFPGYAPSFSTPYAAWVEEYRASIAGRIRKGLVRSIVDLRSKGRYREAEPLARLCLASDPFNEVATLTLAEATAVLSGNRAEALAILDRYMDEVDTSPDRRLSLTASVLRRRISERFVEQRYAAPPEPPFVGREDVLQLLVEKMQEAVTGRSSVVYLWGEPGIGKTRLLEELAKVAAVQGVRVARYAVTPNDPDRPLALFSSLLPQLMKLKGSVGISPEAFEAIQRFIDPTAWELVDPPANAAEAATTFGRLKNGICELFEALAEERALSLFIDDVHWIDPRSLEIVAELIERVRGRRVMVALTSRDALRADTLQAVCARAAVRRLSGLEAAEVETLLARIADQRNFTITSEFVRRSVDASAGNPLFVSELATHYGWNGVRDDLPHNLQTLLEKRLDGLTSHALLAFQTCAVLSEHATVELVAKILGSSTAQLVQTFNELEVNSLLRNHADRVACRHELLRLEALRRLTPIARQALHLKAAEVLEAAALAEMSATVCWHAVQAFLIAKAADRALRLVVTMARRLLSSGLGKDADTLLTKARDVLTHTAVVESILPLQWRAARAHGDFERALQLAIECQRGSSRGTASRQALLAEFFVFDASRVVESRMPRMPFDARRLEEGNQSADVTTDLALRMIISAHDLLQPEAAHQCYAFLNHRGTLRSASRSRRLLFELVYHSDFGKLDVAVERARQITRLPEDAGLNEPIAEPQRLRYAHRPLFLAGYIDEAFSALDLSEKAANRRGSEIDAIYARLYRIEALLRLDRINEAEKRLRALDEQPNVHAVRFVHIAASSVCASLMFVRGEIGEAQTALDEVEKAADPGHVRRNVMLVDSLRILCALDMGIEPDAERLERLTNGWRALASIGSGDLPFLAITASRLTRGLSVSDLCEEYRTTRRERFGIARSQMRRHSEILSKWSVQTPVALHAFHLQAEKSLGEADDGAPERLLT